MDESIPFSDEPIERATEDLLGRRAFLESLTRVFAGWSGESGMVVGLHAAWGEGKTSVVRMLCPTLEQMGYQVLHFNPWEWSSRSDLNDSFFDEIGVELGGGSRRGTEEIAKAWRRYAARLKGSMEVASLAIPVFKGCLILFFLISGIELLYPSRALLICGLFGTLAAAAALWLSRFLPAAANVLRPGPKEDQASLQELKNELRRDLTKWKGRILVIMDDIDRLSPQETTDVLRLVKGNGDLPRVAYLLVGDRWIISKHIEKDLGVNGTSYLEKVVQLSFDLPAIDQGILNEIFFDGFRTILDFDRLLQRFDFERWGEVFWTGIAPAMRNLRSVKKLLATLKFYFAMLNGEGALEVNPVDLVGVEAIRAFEPSLYENLKRSKGAITLSGAIQKVNDQTLLQTLDGLLTGVEAQKRPDWSRLLQLLFPLLKPSVLPGGGDGIAGSTVSSWAKDRRVCSSLFFDRYFMFGVRKGDLSDSSLQALFRKESRDFYKKTLEEFAREGLVVTAIERLRERVADVPPDAIGALTTALFDISDQLSSNSEQLYGVSSLRVAEFTTDALMKRLKPPSQQPVLNRAFVDTVGLKLPIEYLRRLLQQEQDKHPELSVTTDDLSSWRALFTGRIAKQAASGALFSLESAYLYLFYGLLGETQKRLRVL